MKILNLRLSNLNSLVGEWEIDFTDPAYQNDGIFAIIGPTGAGKTTVLDAICLALYGATPRLGKITKSSNELMSRHSGECFSEVTFATQTGCYRAHWYQHRRRRKAGEPLQPQQHEVAEAQSGKIMEEKVSNVPAVIEKITGLDFKRFTRSMLLAQGDFAAFLGASESDRSSILEQITGTDIYADLSVETFARYSKEKQKLLDLQHQLKAVDLMSDDEVEQLKSQLNALQNQYNATYENYQRGLKQRDWLETSRKLDQQQKNLTEQSDRLQRKEEAFRTQRAKLDADMSARKLEARYSELLVRREIHTRLERELKESEESLSSVRRKVIFSQAEHEQAIGLLQDSKDKISAQQPVIKKARALDSEIKSLLGQEASALQRHSEQQEKMLQHKKREQKLRNEKAEAEQTLKTLTTWLVNYQQDASLLNALGRIESNLDSLSELDEQINGLKSDIGSGAKEYAEMDSLKVADEHENEVRQAEKDVQQKADIVSARQQSLRLAHRIESLEEERKSLREHEPCPLCGSLEHPYASDTTLPAPTHLESEYSEAQRQYDRALGHLQRLRVEQVVTQKDIEAGRLRLEDRLQNLNDRLRQVEEKRNTLAGQLHQELDRFQLSVPQADQVEELKHRLRERAERWQQHKEKHQHLSNVVGNILTRLDALSEQILEGERALVEAQERLESVEQTKRSRQRERNEVLDIQDVEEYERALRDDVTQREQLYQKAQQKFYEVNEEQSGLTKAIERLQVKLEESEPVVFEAEQAFQSALKEADFANEKSYLQALIPKEEREKLEQLSQALAQEKQHLQFERERIAQQLEEQKNSAFSAKDPDELDAQIDAAQRRCEELQQQQGALQSQLKHNEEKKHQQTDCQKRLQAQQVETDHWYGLNELIGSADGKKFRNFVQGLTFEIMISHANEQLARMTDRYLLVRDRETPLQLNVVDDYQGGEIRSTRNLSGGESFLVSLALALGLAQMASAKVRVDSLFLDEGFGTLDEDALDMALDALSSLQQRGKVIGVISHVAALKERISNQISVIPGSDGRSKIEGPGITRN